MTILHIDASINGENSASRAISRSIVDQLESADWGREVDLSRPCRRSAAAPDARGLRRHLGRSTSSWRADMIVIGAPMYNFTLPTQLKAWIDRIVDRRKDLPLHGERTARAWPGASA